MLKVAITGGIGSGKTTVCNLFSILGVPVYYADEESKKLLNSVLSVKEAIVKSFGDQILNPETGDIDRKKLASIVFNNKEQLELLNSIMHPAVSLHFDNWCKIQTYPYCLKEAAILFESGAYKNVDKIITVTAPLELRISRSMKRDNATKEEIQARMKNQMPESEKVKRSDFVIFNDEQPLLDPQVFSIHTKLLELASKNEKAQGTA